MSGTLHYLQYLEIWRVVDNGQGGDLTYYHESQTRRL